MNKERVHQVIVNELEQRFKTAQYAAKQAYDAAINEESVAETKYDTFGLESSYLAHGQSQRVLDCERDWLFYKKLILRKFDEDDEIDSGALVLINNLDEQTRKWFYLSPCAGGLVVNIDQEEVYMISPLSPAGRTLMGKYVGDDILLKQNGRDVVHEIVSIL